MIDHSRMNVAPADLAAELAKTGNSVKRRYRVFLRERFDSTISYALMFSMACASISTTAMSAHRPSGNAPQLRIYANSDSQARADEIVELALREPDGILRKLERAFT